MRHAMSDDVVNQLAQTIIARLESGVRPWVRPWAPAGHGLPLRADGERFHGFNALALWMAGDAAEYRSAWWFTYKQAEAVSGQVRRGEKGRKAILYSSSTRQVEDEAGDREETRVFLRSYTVFNAEQIDGLDTRYHAPTVTLAPRSADLSEAARAFFDALPGTVEHGGNSAHYDIARDRIVMPPVEAFARASLYGSTLAHEYCHWTGARHRLARDLGGRFGGDAYAVEELIAELGSALLGAQLGLPADHVENHAAYIASWLGVLRRDPRAILTITGQAQRAVNLLLELAGEASTGGCEERLAA